MQRILYFVNTRFSIHIYIYVRHLTSLHLQYVHGALAALLDFLSLYLLHEV